MPKFRSFHVHAPEVAQEDLGEGGLTSLGGPAEPQLLGVEPMAFDDDESAARHYMDALLAPQDGGGLLGIETVPQLGADMRYAAMQESTATNTRLLYFEQTANERPVLGAQAVVELNPERGFVSMDAHLADAPTVSPVPKLSESDAIERVAAKAGVPVSDLKAVPSPRLIYYQDDSDDSWHLVYEVRNVPAAPEEFIHATSNEIGHGLGASPSRDLIQMTYLVDAHSGDVIVYYSETAWVDDPTDCVGIDELQTPQNFYGFRNGGGAFELRDPMRNIRTFDYAFTNLDDAEFQLPAEPVTHASFDFASTNTAAVSAHVNAMRVFDFFNDVLKRKGVDDAGMELVSVVNCTYRPPGVNWKNAVWHRNRMWYGQVKNAAGTFESYSRYLDVIAHELTHGVTEKTAGLKYLNESGALNESFSDIFGIVVKNLNGPNAGDVAKWDWELGAGLGKNGEPLRDLRDPTRRGQPAHMDQYKKLPPSQDGGGVHTNSGIPNKAAYNVFTATDAQGRFIFDPKRAALMFYLTLRRLTPFASFIDVPNTMKNVIQTLWAGRPQEIEARTAAVADAYAKVGIEEA